jgi:hypothetical protein
VRVRYGRRSALLALMLATLAAASPSPAPTAPSATIRALGPGAAVGAPIALHVGGRFVTAGGVGA